MGYTWIQQTDPLHWFIYKWLYYTYIYRRDNAAGLNAVIEAKGIRAFGIFSPGQEVLLAHEVGLVIDYECPALHPAGVALAQVRGNLRAVADALKRAALEVTLLEEDDLEKKTQIVFVWDYFQRECSECLRLS